MYTHVHTHTRGIALMCAFQCAFFTILQRTIVSCFGRRIRRTSFHRYILRTPGEDPYLTGQYAIRFTKGMQEAPEDPYHIQASACCKHFVLNSLEGTTEKDGEEEDRMHVNSNVTQQDLLDSYMLPFQACVEQGKVSGLMCSYNSVNGVPSCANDWLLKDIARGEWGFDGYVTSDCDADALVSTTHHYHNDTSEEAVRDILRAGTDNDCGGFVGNNAMSALNKSFITMGDIDGRLAMLWRVRFRLGHFDPLGTNIQSLKRKNASLALQRFNSCWQLQGAVLPLL